MVIVFQYKYAKLSQRIPVSCINYIPIKSTAATKRILQWISPLYTGRDHCLTMKDSQKPEEVTMLSTESAVREKLRGTESLD